MKKIEAIIRLSKFDEIRDGLATIGVNFFTMTQVEGFGLERGETLRYRGNAFNSNRIARLKLDIIVIDGRVEEVVKMIVEKGRTGEVGDGKITVYDINQVVRIRTGDEGEHAIMPSK